MILFADKRLARVTMQQGFAADPNSYLDSDRRSTTPTSLSLFSPLLFGVDAAKLLCRGANGKSSRICFSPPEGIRLNHDRWWNVTLLLGCLWRLAVFITAIFWKEDQFKFNGSRSSMEWKLNGSVASRGSRGSPEVGSRRVNDTRISRIYICFSSWDVARMPLNDKWGQYVRLRVRPVFGGYRFGVRHICCKYSWNFSIFMLLFCANPRDNSRKFEWEC